MNSAATQREEAPAQPAPFSYEPPEFRSGKEVVLLARTDRMMAMVQVLKEGGENNLHSHPHQDGFWMVLQGRARFYGEGDKLIADLSKHQGILIPRGARYWFEAAGPEPLELLQVEAFNKPLRDSKEIGADRINHEPRRTSGGEVVVHDGRWK